jgi:type IV pilus assembly protein PilP
MRFVMSLVLGILLAVAAPGMRAQAKPKDAAGAKPASTAGTKPAPQASKPAAQAPAKPKAKSQAKSASKPASKPKSSVKRAPKPEESQAEGATTAEAKESEGKVSRRDPFESLVGRQKAQEAAQKNLPPGKAGLQVSTLRLDGIVKAPNGMIAVVTNPQARTYFLREGDQLYDGRVEKIAMDGVSFHEVGKDAFGKPVERQVNKRIYSTPGEQQ